MMSIQQRIDLERLEVAHNERIARSRLAQQEEYDEELRQLGLDKPLVDWNTGSPPSPLVDWPTGEPIEKA